MNILAVESSCDETAVAVVQDGRRVLTDCIASQVALHRLYGGVVPEIASRKHMEAIYALADEALETAGSPGRTWTPSPSPPPGLIGAVLVGVNFAKAAALALDKPLVPVHHIRGHIAANYIAYPDLERPSCAWWFPAATACWVDVEDYTVFAFWAPPGTTPPASASTRWPGCWVCPTPAARLWTRPPAPATPANIPCPTPISAAIPGHVLSGLKTASINLIHNAGQKGEALDIPALCAPFPRPSAIFWCPDHGGAGADRPEDPGRGGRRGGQLQDSPRPPAGAERRGVRLCLPPLQLCGDNAAMIGARAILNTRPASGPGRTSMPTPPCPWTACPGHKQSPAIPSSESLAICLLTPRPGAPRGSRWSRRSPAHLGFDGDGMARVVRIWRVR